MRSVLVIAATEQELADVPDGAVCGVGPVDAAVTTARLLARRRPGAVLHVGLAGASTFAAAELVLGSEAIYCDAESQSLVTARARLANSMK